MYEHPSASVRSLIGGVLACAALVLAAIGIGGDFPLSDDWSYAYAVRSLCVDGELRMLPWTGASLVLQAWYGALLCKLFGFSFEVLRASTVAMATAGAIGFALLLNEAGIRGRVAALAIATVGLSPLYVNLAFTFMTDVPFTVLCIWSGWLYVRGLRRGETAALIAGAVVCSAALLIRQHGLFLAAAAIGASLWPGPTAERSRLRTAAAAGLAPILVFIAFHVWLFAIHGAPSGVQNKVAEVGLFSVVGVGNLAFRAVEYLGLLLLPIAAAQAGTVWRDAPGRLAAVGTVLGAAALFLYARDGELMFYLPYVLHDLGLGALTLRDTLFLGEDPPLHVGVGLGVTLSLASTAAASVLVTAYWTAMDRRPTAPHAFLIYALALLVAGSLLHVAFYFDRYLLPALPFAVAAALLCLPISRVGSGSWLAAALLAWWAVAGTHDSLEWNRARFAAIAALEREGFDAREIDGGVEYNAWHLADRLGDWPTTEEVRRGQPATRKSWWWVVDDRFIVSFRPLRGYDVRDSIGYSRWLVPGTGRVLVLERETVPPRPGPSNGPVPLSTR